MMGCDAVCQTGVLLAPPTTHHHATLRKSGVAAPGQVPPEANTDSPPSDAVTAAAPCSGWEGYLVHCIVPCPAQAQLRAAAVPRLHNHSASRKPAWVGAEASARCAAQPSLGCSRTEQLNPPSSDSQHRPAGLIGSTGGLDMVCILLTPEVVGGQSKRDSTAS